MLIKKAKITDIHWHINRNVKKMNTVEYQLKNILK